MQESFQAAYTKLNAVQKQAVDTIDGPVMVIAGPGTGKTQLLSTRAARIIATGNANPSNILCLTYTEAGATEMRERISRIVGQQGSEVIVHTFHSFGTMLINQYPEYFSAVRALKPLDDLGRYRIFEQLLSQLPLRHQLAVRGDNEQFIRRHAIEEAVQAFKRAGLSPKELRKIHKQNQAALEHIQPLLGELFSTTLSARRLPEIEAMVQRYVQKTASPSLDSMLLETLQEAVEESKEIGKTKPIGAWRDSHTVIKDGARVFKSAAQATLFSDTIQLYELYQNALASEGKYDYEDMILWAISALENNQDLLLDIAERYQYIMVDEYQDTNGAQGKLLDTVLHANPINSPNIMVVGDDDQAIMRFQGAELSGMVKFVHDYQPQRLVLEDNYRSSQSIIDAARQVIAQSPDRLEIELPELKLQKQLKARAEPKHTSVKHLCFDSPTAQYSAIANHVQTLLKSGIAADQIGIIGRKHAELAAFVPHLTERGIATNYDHHENLLEHPILTELLNLARFIVALHEKPLRAEALLPTVLAASYWELPPLAVYQIAAQAKLHKQTWLDTMLASNNQQWQSIAEWLIAMSSRCLTINFTQCLDLLIGRQPVDGTKLGVSPFMNYLAPDSKNYLSLLSHLIRLRSAVLAARPSAIGMNDLLEVVTEYRLSGMRLVDTNPILKGSNTGVQVMSAHGSKGREFDYVILLSAIDTVWGSRARGQTQRIRLPENLPLYPAGDSESDRLRLLYVAMTRAKSHLLLTSYSATDEGKQVASLSYTKFGEETGWWEPQYQQTDASSLVSPLETAWSPLKPLPRREMADVLQPLLKQFRLSPSALRTFLDIRYGGPQACIEQAVLKFPSAYNAHSALGSAAHKTLEVAYAAFRQASPFGDAQILETFDAALAASGLSEAELEAARVHGHQFLSNFIASFSKSDFKQITSSETFATSMLPVTNVPISGAIDALAESDEGLAVIDYKTGKPPIGGWDTKGLSEGKKVGLHFYRQQLLFYKLLLDNSPVFTKPVTSAELVFVEPSENFVSNEIIRLKITDFTTLELDRTARLIHAVYSSIVSGVLPDTTMYSADLKGVVAFEDYLLKII